MNRIALISDIHGNMPALESVLEWAQSGWLICKDCLFPHEFWMSGKYVRLFHLPCKQVKDEEMRNWSLMR